MSAFKVDFVATLLQIIDTPQVAKKFCKAMFRLHTLLINIRILPTNYPHTGLAPTFVANVPKFRAKKKLFSIIKFLGLLLMRNISSETFMVIIMLSYTSLTQFPKYVKKKLLEHSYKDNPITLEWK